MKLAEWKGQIKSMLHMQALPEEQQSDFVIGALEGEARQQVLLLEDRARRTPTQIFELLVELYGDKVPVAALWSQFFNCSQGREEGLQAFTLSLRELFRRLQRRDPRGLDNGYVLQRDQFILGLREESLRQELRRRVRREEDLKFEDIRREAVLHEEEQYSSVGKSFVSQLMSQAATACPVTSQEDWKKEFRTQMLQEMAGQFKELTRVCARTV
ncbi:hypothetical protein HHUSO_G32352 [Huso huso]|uniref:Paraneoplastic antigen Ma-like C-terminal domain-containing protein n=1 Tax=Huso huso TaxID=61971 RepID=A0ABR0YAH5_HUSHU